MGVAYASPIITLSQATVPKNYPVHNRNSQLFSMEPINICEAN